MSENNRSIKIYKERVDPFLLSDENFRLRYRFSKNTVKKIVGLIENDLKLENRGSGTSPELQVLVALRCWGRREVR